MTILFAATYVNRLTQKRDYDTIWVDPHRTERRDDMATIKDVAKECGLAVATVSRVLNQRGYISEETRKKVYAGMEKLNYVPNEVARSLSKQTTNIIGLIVPNIEHPYFAKLISQVEKAAYESGYRVLVCNSMDREAREEEYLDMCKRNRVAGIIICSGTVQSSRFQGQDIPLIMLERMCEDGAVSIECDNWQGGVLAAEHLIEKGCKKLLCFGNIDGIIMPADNRLEGFRSVCEERQIALIEAQMKQADYYSLSYHEAITKALLGEPSIDGIFASSDVVAAQVIQVCKQQNIQIPNDIKLVGFDDSNLCVLTTPMITTIRQPIAQMARLAISVITNKKEQQLAPVKTVLPVELVERETT